MVLFDAAGTNKIIIVKIKLMKDKSICLQRIAGLKTSLNLYDFLNIPKFFGGICFSINPFK